ncbi:MAG: NDP-sugar synthase [Oscillospiraceae bacterium]|nr:NDP-sugar synthase [Oscillospiraceae bacterium]
MKAIIMAGGKGTRLRPICEALPKPMTGLLGSPLMAHLVALLKMHGFTELCATLGHRPESIMRHFGDGSAFGVSMQYRVEKKPMGTAGGVRCCEDFIGNADFLVISGDAACDFDLTYLAAEHKRRGAPVTIALYPHSEPLPYGTVLTDSSGRVVSFIEKPSWERVVTDLVNTGIYMISPEIFALIPPDTAFDFARDLFPLMAARHLDIVGIPMQGYWCDIGNSRSYLRCCLDALDGRLKLRPAQSNSLPSGVHAPVGLPASIRLEPPCVICDGAAIGHDAVIGRSVIHAGSRIGAYSRVVNSVIDGAKIGEACVISGTVVCSGVALYPGTVTGRGDVIAAGPSTVPSPAEPDKKPERCSAGLRREISCDNRAGLMRALSAVLWETGADFSDGISLLDGHCRVRISPLSEESAIAVEAVGGREDERIRLCEKYGGLVEKHGGKTAPNSKQ